MAKCNRCCKRMGSETPAESQWQRQLRRSPEGEEEEEEGRAEGLEAAFPQTLFPSRFLQPGHEVFA